VHYSDDRFAQYIASHLPLEVMVKHTGCCYSVVATIIALDTTMHVFDATNGCNWRFVVFKDENDLLGVHKTYEFAIQQSKITAFKHEGRWVIRSGNPKDDGQVLWLVCQNYADTKREISKVAGRARPLPAALPATLLPRSPRCSPRHRQS
jgi:hypothetical protein